MLTSLFKKSIGVLLTLAILLSVILPPVAANAAEVKSTSDSIKITDTKIAKDAQSVNVKVTGFDSYKNLPSYSYDKYFIELVMYNKDQQENKIKLKKVPLEKKEDYAISIDNSKLKGGYQIQALLTKGTQYGSTTTKIDNSDAVTIEGLSVEFSDTLTEKNEQAEITIAGDIPENGKIKIKQYGADEKIEASAGTEVGSVNNKLLAGTSKVSVSNLIVGNKLVAFVLGDDNDVIEQSKPITIEQFTSIEITNKDVTPETTTVTVKVVGGDKFKHDSTQNITGSIILTKGNKNNTDYADGRTQLGTQQFTGAGEYTFTFDKQLLVDTNNENNIQAHLYSFDSNNDQTDYKYSLPVIITDVTAPTNKEPVIDIQEKSFDSNAKQATVKVKNGSSFNGGLLILTVGNGIAKDAGDIDSRKQLGSVAYTTDKEYTITFNNTKLESGQTIQAHLYKYDDVMDVTNYSIGEAVEISGETSPEPPLETLTAVIEGPVNENVKSITVKLKGQIPSDSRIIVKSYDSTSKEFPSNGGDFLGSADATDNNVDVSVENLTAGKKIVAFVMNNGVIAQSEPIIVEKKEKPTVQDGINITNKTITAESKSINVDVEGCNNIVSSYPQYSQLILTMGPEGTKEGRKEIGKVKFTGDNSYTINIYTHVSLIPGETILPIVNGYESSAYPKTVFGKEVKITGDPIAVSATIASPVKENAKEITVKITGNVTSGTILLKSFAADDQNVASNLGDLVGNADAKSGDIKVNVSNKNNLKAGKKLVAFIVGGEQTTQSEAVIVQKESAEAEKTPSEILKNTSVTLMKDGKDREITDKFKENDQSVDVKVQLDDSVSQCYLTIFAYAGNTGFDPDDSHNIRLWSGFVTNGFQQTCEFNSTYLPLKPGYKIVASLNVPVGPDFYRPSNSQAIEIVDKDGNGFVDYEYPDATIVEKSLRPGATSLHLNLTADKRLFKAAKEGKTNLNVAIAQYPADADFDFENEEQSTVYNAFSVKEPITNKEVQLTKPLKAGYRVRAVVYWEQNQELFLPKGNDYEAIFQKPDDSVLIGGDPITPPVGEQTIDIQETSFNSNSKSATVVVNGYEEFNGGRLILTTGDQSTVGDADSRRQIASVEFTGPKTYQLTFNRGAVLNNGDNIQAHLYKYVDDSTPIKYAYGDYVDISSEASSEIKSEVGITTPDVTEDLSEIWVKTIFDANKQATLNIYTYTGSTFNKETAKNIYSGVASNSETPQKIAFDSKKLNAGQKIIAVLTIDGVDTLSEAKTIKVTPTKDKAEIKILDKKITAGDNILDVYAKIDRDDSPASYKLYQFNTDKLNPNSAEVLKFGEINSSTNKPPIYLQQGSLKAGYKLQFVMTVGGEEIYSNVVTVEESPNWAEPTIKIDADYVLKDAKEVPVVINYDEGYKSLENFYCTIALYKFDGSITDQEFFDRELDENSTLAPIIGTISTSSKDNVVNGKNVITLRDNISIKPGDKIIAKLRMPHPEWDDNADYFSSSVKVLEQAPVNPEPTPGEGGDEGGTTPTPGGGSVTPMPPVVPETPETEVKPDGTKVETQTEEDGTTIETTTKPNGDVTEVVSKPDGSATTTETRKDGTKVETQTTAQGKTTATIVVPEGQKNVVVTIPKEDLKPNQVAVITKADGTKEVIKKSVASEDGLKLMIDENVKVEIVDNSKTFNDTNKHWANEAIDFVTSREIFNGMGEETFAPETAMTRAMLVQVLYNFENQPQGSKDANFGDVSSDAWFADAVAWAADNKIVSGVGDGNFAPNDEISREQLVTILYRYAGEPKPAGSLDKYSDASNVSDYAQDAMLWAVENGIVSGMGNNTLAPQGQATRAQVAQIMMNFCDFII